MLTDRLYMVADFGHDVTLWILLILSVFSVAFMLERWLVLRGVLKNTRKISGRLREALQANNLKDIEHLSHDRETLEGRALSYGLRHIEENGKEGLEEIFTSYASMEKPHLEKYLSFLATVGSNAPFIGLLGTVFGIMDAFRALAVTQGDPAAVMLGISQALIATAVGLMVAIPAVVAYNYFHRQVKSVLQSLDSVKDLCLAYSQTKKQAKGTV